ncbi:hypothetical protein OESDEN_09816 [Oesophagostomum dentatum]|uniref:Uncharacterized protein n=1 Tax=Oesophagostomum dentatum TaxID=61180 RepID=A0A0B1T3G6_OESDE|nr:hypothetical protein OESDEN_09816 [Oesophagostomum dentatum]
MYCRCTSLSSFTSVLIERNFASYFVDDYEKTPRRWIAFSVISISCLLSMIYTAPVSFGIFSLGDFTFVVFTICVICSVVYVLLYRHDKRKLHLLINDAQHIRYKLAARFQLKENLRVLKVR